MTVSYPAVYFALALNKKLDNIAELHKDKHTEHEINQARQLIDDLFTGYLKENSEHEPPEYHSERD